MTEKIIDIHSIEVNEKSNGSETIVITTTLCDEGDPDPFLIQEITMMSYGNSANFQLGGSSVLTPRFLRRMADELEAKIITAKTRIAENDNRKG